MSDSACRTFLRGSAISLAGTILLGVMNYFVRRTLSVSLTVTDYGAFYSIFSLISLIYAFGDLGLNQSATALIAKYAGTGEQHLCFSALLLFRLGISILTTLAVLLAAGFLSRHYLNGVSVLPVMIVSVLFFFQSIDGCFGSLYNGLKEFGTQQLFQLLGGAILLTGILCAGKNLIAASSVFLGTAVCTLSCNFLFCRLRKKVRYTAAPPAKVWCELFSLGGRLAVATALFSSLYHMDTVMLTFLKGKESSALYNIALPIMQIVQAAMVFPVVMLPVAVDMCRQEDWVGLRKFARTAFALALLAAPCCYLFFHWTGSWLVKLLFAEKYAAASPAVPLLCSALVFYTLGHFLLQLLIGLNACNRVVLIACLCFVSNLILNYLLISRYDFIGAGAATLLSYMIFAFSSFTALLLILRKRGKNE